MKIEDRTARPGRQRRQGTTRRVRSPSVSATRAAQVEAYVRGRRPPEGDCEPFHDFVHAVTFESEAQILQAEVDAATLERFDTYEHLWFGWEFLRRSPDGSVCAWWQSDSGASSTTERAMQQLFRRIVGQPPREKRAAPLPADDPVRCYSFPVPVPDGGCPPESAHEERVLLALLRRFMAAPVTVGCDRSVSGLWSAGRSSPARVMVHW